jgi:hypoxanthine phosphoribosyltransferase
MNMELREMTEHEGRVYFDNMLLQIKEYNPKEIIAVARSGFSYAAYVAQRLDLPLGVYYPGENFLYRTTSHKRIVFVDDNTVLGGTYEHTKDYMKQEHPDTEWTWAVFFADWNTPKKVRDSIIYGTRLAYFAKDGYWGRMFSEQHKETFGTHTLFRDLV